MRAKLSRSKLFYAILAGATAAIVAMIGITTHPLQQYVYIGGADADSNRALVVNAEAFCARYKGAKKRSIISDYSYSSEDSRVDIFEHKTGDSSLLQIGILCNESLETFLSDITNEALSPHVFDVETNTIITQRGDPTRFIFFERPPPQDLARSARLLDLTEYLYGHGGVGVGGCYFQKHRCYVSIARRSPATDAKSAPSSQAATHNLNFVRISVDAQPEQLLGTTKMVIPEILKSIR